MAGLANSRTKSNPGRALVRRSWIPLSASILGGIILSACLGVTALAQKAPDLAGTWQGTLPTENGLRIMVKIHKADAGGWQGEVRRMDEDDTARTATSISLHGAVLSLAVSSIEVRYDGKLSADGLSINGSWRQGSQTTALNLVRATSETEWVIESNKRMAAGADPAFDVVTIKPANPEEQMSGFMSGNGRQINCANESLGAILTMVYGVHSKQILGAPDWADSRWDIDGFPDTPGLPSDKQMYGMYRKLLAERFHLVMHTENRTMAAYALTVGKTGPKLIRSLDQEGGSDTTGLEWSSQRRVLRVTSTDMEGFVLVMQSSLDKPTVNQTGLAGKWDFLLKWRPDDSPTADANALPGIFTAMQEQLGLKLESVKAPVDVIIIDHVERPSAN